MERAAGRAALPLEELAEVFGKAAREMVPDADVDKTVARIVSVAATTVPGTEHAGVSLLESGRIRSVAPSSELVSRLDQLQHELGEGPCVDAVLEDPVYRTGDLSTDSRWPRFAPAAAARGMRSLLGVRLFTTRSTVGSLNLYSGVPDAFDTESVHLAELFAAHAALALTGSQKQAQLKSALDSRDIIATAKGMLMERYGIGGEQAFNLLVRISQEQNTKLREIAERLIQAHTPRA